ncbi:hypothetical protein ACVOMV_34810 [Mesorhizobium atlanticum]
MIRIQPPLSVSVSMVRFLVYVIAGGCYGLWPECSSAPRPVAAIPLVGNPLLLSMFAAVVVGGTRLGGGRAARLGDRFRRQDPDDGRQLCCWYLTSRPTISTIAEGTILILAVLAGSTLARLGAGGEATAARAQFAAWRAGILPAQLDRADRRMLDRSAHAVARRCRTSLHVRYAETFRYALPAYNCLVAIVIATQLWLSHAILNPGYWNSLLVLSSFLAVLALGQGTVSLTGGLDLSVPWTIGLCGIILAGTVNGSDAAAGLRAACGIGDGAGDRLRQRRRNSLILASHRSS